MKFTLNWLKTHLDTEATLDEITYALTDLGLEVEGVENPADTLGIFRLCRVIEAVQHPNADRLRLCRVETYPDGPDGKTEEVQVVCGAPNARTGLVGVFAPVGAYVPGIDLTLKPGKIRDVESLGMLCSERELMISDEHDGIIDLPADAPLGARFIDYLDRNDPVIDIAITPNRPDALGVRGVARDLAARGLGKLKPAKTANIKGGFESPIKVSIDEDTLKDAPVFAGRVIRNVKNGPSPQWLQDRLRAIGLRPISTLVDITNFFTYDLNRPLHVFDADKVSGDLRVRYAEDGEKLVALDDKEYRFSDDVNERPVKYDVIGKLADAQYGDTEGLVVISDGNGVQSIAGIMGGAATGCSSGTVNVFVESAYWDPIAIAMTGRKLKINSDARYRFERGIDPAFTPEGLDLACEMVLELCGGEASDMVLAGEVPDTSRAYKLDPSRVVSLVGMEIAEAEQIRILTALGFEVNDLMVSVPSWRPDVQGEADLVEEIARVASLTKLVGKPLSRPGVGVMKPVLTASQKRLMLLRRALALGLNECVTYSFIDQKSAALFGGGSDAVKLSNPISSEMSHMRPDILPSLLQAAARNQARGEADMALFEIGQGFKGAEPEDQSTMACGIRVGTSAPRNAFGTRRTVDIYDAKGDAEAALAAIGAPVGNLMVLRNAPEWFHPGRSAVLSLGPKNPLAIFGELHPKVLKAMGVKGTVVGFTIFPDNVSLKKAKTKTRPALEANDLQAVERDFAFVVDATVEAEKLVKAAKGGDKKLIAAVSVFDIFSGAKAEAQMGAGKKSVAITVRIQPKAATLTDKEIEAISAKIVASVARKTGGELRS